MFSSVFTIPFLVKGCCYMVLPLHPGQKFHPDSSSEKRLSAVERYIALSYTQCHKLARKLALRTLPSEIVKLQHHCLIFHCSKPNHNFTLSDITFQRQKVKMRGEGGGRKCAFQISSFSSRTVALSLRAAHGAKHLKIYKPAI